MILWDTTQDNEQAARARRKSAVTSEPGALPASASDRIRGLMLSLFLPHHPAKCEATDHSETLRRYREAVERYSRPMSGAAE